MRENILFTSAGNNTNFYDLWCTDNRNYDIFVCYYGNEEFNKYEEYSDFYLKRKGSKMQNFHFVWTNNIGNIQDYKFFYIVDDDIIIKTDEINELFKLFKELDPWILQPSFAKGSKIDHGITKQKLSFKYRYTNFVEINTPFFSNYSISKCMETYDPVLTGYGIDILFIHTLGINNKHKFVIVDYISCINPDREEREIDKLQPLKERMHNWKIIQKSLKLENIDHKNYSYVKNKMKILLLYKGYPRISHSYQSVEAFELCRNHEIMIISFDWDLFTKADNHLPFTFIHPLKHIKSIREFKPDIIHSHYLDTFDICAKLSQTLRIPFTIKSHSFDILADDFSLPKRYVKQINDNKNCLKILVFPEFFDKLVGFGINRDKLLAMYPTIDLKKFLNLDIANGSHIMSGGAFLPKKNVKGFILLSKRIKERFPEKCISYYSVMENRSYYDEMIQFNAKHGNPVNFVTTQPENMPLEYKKHQWLIYTACPELKTVGNPLMIAEAQASGVGVIMYALRKTLKDYVTDNGYLYKDDDEVLGIISDDFSDDKRKKAIEIAKSRYDIKDKIRDLESCWV